MTSKRVAVRERRRLQFTRGFGLGGEKHRRVRRDEDCGMEEEASFGELRL